MKQTVNNKPNVADFLNEFFGGSKTKQLIQGNEAESFPEMFKAWLKLSKKIQGAKPGLA